MVYYRKIKTDIAILVLKNDYKHPITCTGLREFLWWELRILLYTERKTCSKKRFKV